MISSREEMRKMAERVVLDRERDKMQVILLTSPSGGEGVSFVARQFADELISTHDLRVFLMEAPESTAGDAVPEKLPEAFFQSLRENYDLILVDGGGLLHKSGSLTYLSHCDTALVVLKAENTLREQARELLKLLERYSVRPQGIILNGVLDPVPEWLKAKAGLCS